MTHLASYILAAVLAMSPAKHHKDETPEDYTDRVAAFAEDVTAVVDDEAPIFKGDYDRSRSAVLLTVIAFFESGFQRYVMRGDCNDPAWAAKNHARLLSGDCDGALGGYAMAATAWQIQAQDGIVLLAENAKAPGPDWSRASNFPWQWRSDPVNAERVIDRGALLTDQRLAARVALHLLRRALRGGSLCGYSGEAGPCPKADARLKFAVSFSQRHLFDVNKSF